MTSEIPLNLPELLASAWQARASFHADPATDCYRVFHGYSEGLPGLSIDRYGTAAIVNKKVEYPLAEAELVRVLRALFPFDRIVQKSHQRVEAGKGERVRYLFGERSPDPHRVKEGGAWYLADLDYLHSNGLYMDARPARAWLRENSRGRRIYNLFSHTGSLGLAAMLGGAKDVIHIDKSAEALERIADSYGMNGLRLDRRSILKGDIYYHLPRAIKWGQKFQGIILDPPPFIPQPYRARDHRPEGQDFQTLIELSCKLLDPGGWLLCIYHDFRKSHDEYDREIVHASRDALAPVWRDRAHADFPESEPDRWTRMSAFVSRIP